MKLQKYIIKSFFESSNGVDMDIIPIHEKSKEDIISKMQYNLSIYPKSFELYNYDWNVSDIKKYGYEILTVSEFWGDS